MASESKTSLCQLCGQPGAYVYDSKKLSIEDPYFLDVAGEIGVLARLVLLIGIAPRFVPTSMVHCENCGEYPSVRLPLRPTSKRWLRQGG